MKMRFQTTVHIHPKLRAMIETEVPDLVLSIQLFGAGQSEDAARDSGPTSSRQTPSLAWGTGASTLLCETNPLPGQHRLFIGTETARLLERSRLMNKALLYLTLLYAIPWLGFAQTQSTPAPDSSTGIEGTISVGPVQGGPTRQGGVDSQPLARMAFEVKQAGRVVKSFQTDARGSFSVLLRPGHYTIVRKDWQGAIGFYGPFEAEVAPGKMKKVDWKCDSGLR